MRMLQMSAQAPIAVWHREVIGMGPVRESIDCCLAFIFQSFSSTLEYVSSKAIGHKMRLGFQLVSLSVVIAGHSFTWTRRIRIRTSHHCVDNMIWIDLSWQLRPSLTRRLRMNPWKRRCLLEIIIFDSRPNLTQDLQFDETCFCSFFPRTETLRGRLHSELSLKRGATSALEATVVTLEPMPEWQIQHVQASPLQNEYCTLWKKKVQMLLHIYWMNHAIKSYKICFDFYWCTCFAAMNSLRRNSWASATGFGFVSLFEYPRRAKSKSQIERQIQCLHCDGLLAGIRYTCTTTVPRKIFFGSKDVIEYLWILLPGIH